jgi:hypothetical protein
MHRLLAVSIGFAMLAGCTDLPADPVFVGARVDPIDCADGQRECVVVFSEADGNRAGTGSCVLYATTRHGRVAVAASGELELVPGAAVEWVVRVPSHFDDWDPVCVPTAEG